MQNSALQTAMHTDYDPWLLTRRRAPATCGELVQGTIDERDFLVNCPIDLYSHASVYASAAPGLHIWSGRDFSKIADTLTLAAEKWNLTLEHELVIDSEIPRSKGMASSTADITAALEAVCGSWGLRLPADVFARVLAAIEPSDCVHFPGIAHVNHLTGALIESMPAPDDLRVLVVDCGGEIETLRFDRERARSVYRANRPAIAAALSLVKRGLHCGDAVAVARAATQSAHLSQQILHKPQFDDLLAQSLELGALGVNCAHSGTVLGVLYRTDDRTKHALARSIDRDFGADLRIVGDFRIIGGGCVEY